MPPVLSKIDNITKDIVNGWLRRQQQQLNTIIPNVLNGICIIYYYEDEIFETNPNHKILNRFGININLGSNRRCICITTNKIDPITAFYQHRVYGVNEIMVNNIYCNYIYQWTMKIHDATSICGYHSVIMIGFQNNTMFAYGNDGKIEEIGYPGTRTTYGQKFGTDDEVSVSLNTKTTEVRYEVNGCDQGFAFKVCTDAHQETRVKLQIIISGLNNHIELIKFHRQKC